MRPKKNPKADLNNYSSLFFVIGLTIVLFATWRVLEIKSYDKPDQVLNIINVMDDIKENVPITKSINTPPPPPPPAAPDVIEIVEDLSEIEETTIESTESSQDMKVDDYEIALDDVNMEEVEEDIIVPFAIIENAPIFPGCEDLASEEERRACFNKMVQIHIKNNFVYPETALEMGISGRVFVQFTIDKDGCVRNIRERGPDQLLEKEANRIISTLPIMKPGMQRGKPARVKYSIPIQFKMRLQ